MVGEISNETVKSVATFSVAVNKYCDENRSKDSNLEAFRQAYTGLITQNVDDTEALERKTKAYAEAFTKLKPETQIELGKTFGKSFDDFLKSMPTEQRNQIVMSQKAFRGAVTERIADSNKKLKEVEADKKQKLMQEYGGSNPEQKAKILANVFVDAAFDIRAPIVPAVLGVAGGITGASVAVLGPTIAVTVLGAAVAGPFAPVILAAGIGMAIGSVAFMAIAIPLAPFVNALISSALTAVKLGMDDMKASMKAGVHTLVEDAITGKLGEKIGNALFVPEKDARLKASEALEAKIKGFNNKVAAKEAKVQKIEKKAKPNSGDKKSPSNVADREFCLADCNNRLEAVKKELNETKNRELPTSHKLDPNLNLIRIAMLNEFAKARDIIDKYQEKINNLEKLPDTAEHDVEREKLYNEMFKKLEEPSSKIDTLIKKAEAREDKLDNPNKDKKKAVESEVTKEDGSDVTRDESEPRVKLEDDTVKDTPSKPEAKSNEPKGNKVESGARNENSPQVELEPDEPSKPETNIGKGHAQKKDNAELKDKSKPRGILPEIKINQLFASVKEGAEGVGKALEEGAKGIKKSIDNKKGFGDALSGAASGLIDAGFKAAKGVASHIVPNAKEKDSGHAK